MSPRRNIRIATAAALALTALLAGCAAHSGTGSSGGALTVGAEADGPFTRNFNPLDVVAHTAVGYSGNLIYEPLEMPDFASGTDKPWLATSLTYSNGGRTLTIDLRHGVEWSDGTPFTSKDVAFTFGLLKKYAALNPDGYPIASATATSSYVTTVQFTRPAYTYPIGRLYIVPAHLWEHVPNPVTYTDPNPVGTGPYLLKNFSPQTITFVKNTRYWRSPGARVNTVQFLSYDSSSSMIASLESGSLDWATASVADPSAVVKSDPAHIRYFSGPSDDSDVLLIPNVTVYPLGLAVVRKAMSMAIDRESVSRIGLGGSNPPAVSPTGLKLPTYRSYLAPQYQNLTYPGGDPAAARRALIAAGFTTGANGTLNTPHGRPLDLTLTVPTASAFGNFETAAQIIAAELGKAGIDVTVQTQDALSWRQDTTLGHFQLTLRATGGEVNPFTFFNDALNSSLSAPVGKPATRDFGRYSNPQADHDLALWAANPPGSQAARSAQAGIESVMVNDVPAIPVFFASSQAFWRTGAFTGFPDGPDPYPPPFGNIAGTPLVLTDLSPVGH